MTVATSLPSRAEAAQDDSAPIIAGTWQNTNMPSGRDRRRSERFPTASIPVQLSDIDGELIDLSLSGAAVIHRSPINAGAPATLVFPSYGGIYIPCKVLRSLVQVRRTGEGPEYVFRSAISFAEMEPEQRDPLREFLQIQIARLKEKQDEALNHRGTEDTETSL
jgi:hypothetical protein